MGLLLGRLPMCCCQQCATSPLSYSAGDAESLFIISGPCMCSKAALRAAEYGAATLPLTAWVVTACSGYCEHVQDVTVKPFPCRGRGARSC